jgi:hypothetical protein
MEGSEARSAPPDRGGPEVAVRRWGSVLTRWLAAGALTFLAFAFIQSLRHPARLWSPGLMGRVLAWGGDIEGERGGGPGS